MNRKMFWIFILVSMVVLAGYFLVTVLKRGRTKLIFCDVGQGNGVLLTKGEFQLIYDTGPDNGRMLDCLARQMPFWDKKIEVVIISHWDNDHGGGLAQIVDYYKIDSLYASKMNEQYSYANVLACGDVIKYDWMEFKVISVDREKEDNYGSVVGLLDLGDFEALLMGDVPMEVEQRLVWSGVKRDLDLAEKLKSVEVLLVGHHGSRGSTGEELLELLTEEKVGLEAVISVGKNSFGHPTGEVLDRLDKYGIKTRRTDQEGDIIYLGI